MRVYLIGYMGVGKTTIGKKLSKVMDLKFIDLDGFIGLSERHSVPEIIKIKGEAYFRDLEKKYLEKVSEMEDVLISTGGGTPCYFDNMRVINEKGVSVYLEMNAKSLARRLENGMESRPLLRGKTKEELHGFITQHLLERMPFYEQADIRFEALNFSAERAKELAKNILNKGLI